MYSELVVRKWLLGSQVREITLWWNPTKKRAGDEEALGDGTLLIGASFPHGSSPCR